MRCLVCGPTTGRLIRGLCESHYQLARKQGILDRFPRKRQRRMDEPGYRAGYEAGYRAAKRERGE